MSERLPPRKATYADIEALPDHVVGEILAGELVVSPRPRLRHASALGGIQTQTMGPSVHSGDAAAAIPPFEAVPIELGLLWKP